MTTVDAELGTTQALPALHFRLPGHWWTVSLLDRDAASASAKRLIRHRVGITDDRAALRAKLHRGFVNAIDEAIAGGGQRMFIAIEVIEAVPLPITITVYLLDQAMTPAIGTGADAVAGILRQGLEGLDDQHELGDLQTLALADTLAIRSDRVRMIEVGEGEDRGDAHALVVDYWLAVPDTKRVVLVNFSSSFPELRENLVGLFDAIMRVTYWQAD